MYTGIAGATIAVLVAVGGLVWYFRGKNYGTGPDYTRRASMQALRNSYHADEEFQLKGDEFDLVVPQGTFQL
jgi:hypothetical protein